MAAARSDVTTRLRLASGLVLVGFVATHLINRALGIHSLAAMKAGRELFVALWRSWPGTLLLYVALAGHVLLVVHRLYRRRSLRMPAWEAAQIVLGLLIPFWLVVHVVGTRGAHEVYGVDDRRVRARHPLAERCRAPARDAPDRVAARRCRLPGWKAGKAQSRPKLVADAARQAPDAGRAAIMS